MRGFGQSHLGTLCVLTTGAGAAPWMCSWTTQTPTEMLAFPMDGDNGSKTVCVGGSLGPPSHGAHAAQARSCR